jgi:hypothetical protein
MTWYRQIVPVSDPSDIGLDDNGRPQVVFSINVVKGLSTTFLEELGALLLQAPAVGALNTNIFLGTQAQIPAEGGPYLHVRAGGGAAPENLHDQQGPAYPRPDATVTVCAPTYRAARTLAFAAWTRLSAVRNRDVTAVVIP